MARIDARPGDWKADPPSAHAAPMAYKRSFSAAEFARLKRGLVPEAMEDKWFIVWHDDALWLHRSWTGLCVYRLRFVADGDRFVVVETLAERPDAADANALDYLLDTFLRFSARFR